MFPKASVIMPTYNRRYFIPHAIRYFLRQDYPNTELIIVDDGEDKVGDLIPVDVENIRYVTLPFRREVGTKRNRACSLATGEFICSQDDDDWFSPSYLSTMLVPLLSGEADMSVCTVQAMPVFDVTAWQRWRYRDDARLARFVHDGTLCFRRSWWERGCHYPDQSIGQDTMLLNHMQLEGARLAIISSQDTFVYVRHGSNVWPFQAGTFLREDVWEQVEDDGTWPMGREDMAFYEQMRTHIPPQGK